MFSVACSNEEKITINVFPKTASGKPATFDGPIKVTVQSGDGTVEAPTTENPNSFKLVSGDIAGQTVYLVEADVDKGEGVRNIQETVELTVSSVEAADFGFSVGSVEPK